MTKRTREQIKKDILDALFKHNGELKQAKLYRKVNLSHEQFKGLCQEKDLTQFLEIEKTERFKWIRLNEAGYLALNL